MLNQHLRGLSARCSFLLLALFGLAPPSFANDLELDRFEKTTLCVDLVQPMELDIAPDGRIFLIELGGTVKVLDPETRAVSVVGQLQVTTEQENGLIGLALDPNFADNGWIYLQYSPPDFSGQHVSRFTLRENKIDMASEKVMFKYEEQRRECCHHAGSLEFGPDGNLYIGTGDNTNPFNDSEGYAPIDERPGREPWDAQRTSGNTKSYNGKILRIHPETDGTYTIPDGNLFPKDGSIGHPEIYVMGCRNPWRINVDAKTGFLYWGDVGPDAGQEGPRGPRGYDEINQARRAGNFGWPYFIGKNFAYHMVDFATGEIGPPQDPMAPRNESVNNTGSQTLPPAQPAMVYYPGSSSEQFPEVGSGGRTACAGPVYYYDPDSPSQNKFPAAYDATLFAFEWSRNMIYAVHLGDDGNVQQVERFLPEMTFVRPIDMQFDTNGALHVIEYGETWGVNPDARLVRIDYVRGNRAPVAIAAATNDVGREPLTVELRAGESYDKDGDSLSYRWTAIRNDVTPPQRMPLGSGAQITSTFDQAGVYTVELEASDPEGLSAVATLPVIVGNAPPQVEFLSPKDGDFYNPGESITYRLVVRDQEDGTSDPDEAEEEGSHFIDGGAGSRLTVEALPAVSQDSAAVVDPGFELIRKSDCLNCHAVNRPRVGPSFVDIATKYRDQPHQIEQSVSRVLQGSTGVWGKVGMLPHLQHTPAEVRRMVEFVYSVTADSANPTAVGFRNDLATDESMGDLQLEATYIDLGRDNLPKLAGTTKITLRSRRLQAEAADDFAGTQPLGSDRAEGKRFMGAIEHDGYLKFVNIPLDGLTEIAASVTSAGAGGTIEVRRGSVDGPLLGSVEVKVNGSWEDFQETTIQIEPSAGNDDLFFVFKNARNRGGLMNVDALSFR